MLFSCIYSLRSFQRYRCCGTAARASYKVYSHRILAQYLARTSKSVGELNFALEAAGLANFEAFVGEDVGEDL